MIVTSLIALMTLSAMEIVLGIDNIVFISILTSKLPLEQQSLARRVGLSVALVLRLLLLSTVFWLVHLTNPVVQLDAVFPLVNQLQPMFHQRESLPQSSAHGNGADDRATTTSDSHPPASGPKDDEQELLARLNEHAWREFVEVSWRDIILIAGGLFLLFKSVKEIHGEMEGHAFDGARKQTAPTFRSVIGQICIMDIIFSLDSVITAVGMANQLWVMFVAVVVAVGVMILFANQVGHFVDGNPTIKMLALNFLLLIGVMLVAEGLGTPINKAYIYFAMVFSLAVEFLNMRVRTQTSG